MTAVRITAAAFIIAALVAAVAIAQQAAQIKATATGGGYYRVFVAGVQVSQHTTERAAFERGANEKMARPGADVYYDHDYRVSIGTTIVPPNPPVEPDKPVDPPVDPDPPTEPDDPPPVDLEPVDPEPPTDPDEPTEPDSPDEPDAPSGDGNAHFEAMLEHPNLLKAWTMRRIEDFANRRGGRFEDGVNPTASYDPVLDAGVITWPPLKNELTGVGGCMFNWGSNYPWEVGDTLVIQHDFMLTSAFRENIRAPLTNGRVADHFKFYNLCRGGPGVTNPDITYEFRTHFRWHKQHTMVDVRVYPPTGEGRLERDEFAKDVSDPKRTFRGSGGGYDRHTGPDPPEGSTWKYEQKSWTHPETFMVRNDKWIRVTWQLTRVANGTRIHVWIADEDTGPLLLIASPVDPSLGHLVLNSGMITDFYLEGDTSQDGSYDTPQPDRPTCWRNMLVFAGIAGESVLGGRPVR